MPCTDPRHARTFADLYEQYRQTWPAPDAPAGQLLRVARQITAESQVELWDHLDTCLRHSMRWYTPARGPFLKLFERNLRERLRKATARDARARRRERRALAAHAKYPEKPCPREAAFTRWAARLLDLVAARLDEQARTYLERRRRGFSVKQIAAALGVTPKTLWNKFGGTSSPSASGARFAD